MNMENFEIYKQGAEAKLFKGKYLGKETLAKERFPKKYRHPDLDNTLTKERIKAESRAILRCKNAGIKTPSIYLIDYKRRTIFFEYFEPNLTLKTYIEQHENDDTLEQISIKIGKLIGKMHQNNVIHGDLTSSNILLIKRNINEDFTLNNIELVLIDFGLAHTECSVEDKGVDLYVLERALLSTHRQAQKMFTNILKGYKEEYKSGFKDVFIKYEDVRARGRKRTMIG